MKQLFLYLIFACFLVSCGSSNKIRITPEIRELAHSSIRLGFDITEQDNWPLLVEASKWIGVPYRMGGETMQGVDCSGLSVAIYRNVYGKKLSRRTSEQYSNDVTLISKSKLKQGCLVFFSSPKSKGKVAHSGIYLKDGYFIHASSSKGVVVSKLAESYWQNHWIGGGIVRL